MNISVIGTGYVGLVTGACLAEIGNKVICADNDKKKIDKLKKLIIPIYEEGLQELVKKNVSKKRLSFTTDIGGAVGKADIIFIAVGTPSKPNGDADLTGIENVARVVAQNMKDYKVIVEKSTVPVQTGEWIKHTINVYNKKNIKYDVVSNPEFLREGKAISDFMHPDRIVIGVESKRAGALLKKLYKPLKAPVIVTDIKSAEIIKHASNSFLATKISFINAVSTVCEKVGADIVKVAEGMGLDKRIGRAFLDAGAGYGGSCFPKDLDAFIKIAHKAGYDFELLEAVKTINEKQKHLIIHKIEKALWIIKDKTIGILGIAFKPGTDDIRMAPSLDIIKLLQEEGAKIKAYDPQAMEKARQALGNVKFCKDAYQVAKDSDCLCVITEWDEFKKLDLLKVKRLLRQPVIVDGRNIFDPKKMKTLGFRYSAVGRT